jgi:hypothetical protein
MGVKGWLRQRVRDRRDHFHDDIVFVPSLQSYEKFLYALFLDSGIYNCSREAETLNGKSLNLMPSGAVKALGLLIRIRFCLAQCCETIPVMDGTGKLSCMYPSVKVEPLRVVTLTICFSSKSNA